MKVAIFIAGEHYGTSQEEYDRYCAAFPDGRMKVSRPVKGFLFANPSGQSPQCNQGPRDYVYYVDAKEEYAVVAVKKDEFLRGITEKVLANGSEFTKEDVVGILKSLAHLKVLERCDSPIEAYVFAHWHADPFIVERSLRTHLEGITPTEISEILGAAVERIRMFAVSSLRPELFDVKASTFEVPMTIKELEELVQGFEADACSRGTDVAPNHKVDAVDGEKCQVLSECVLKMNLAAHLRAKPDGAKDIVPFLVVLTGDRRRGVAIKTALCEQLKKIGTVVEKYDQLCVCDIHGFKRVLPIILDDVTDYGGRGSLAHIGACPPPEFIFAFDGSEKDLKKVEDSAFVGSVKSRLAFWETEGTLAHGVSVKEVRDWFAGAFRKHFFLDENVHGTSGEMKLSEAQDNPKTFVSDWFDGNGDKDKKTLSKQFLNRLSSFDKKSLLGKSPSECLLHVLFQDSFNKLLALRDTKNRDDKFYESVRQTFRHEDSGGVIASSMGLATHFTTPSATVRVLVVDDHGDEEIMLRLTNDTFPGFDFVDFFGWLAKAKGVARADLEITRANLFHLFDEGVDELKKVKESFDAVLLDLCLTTNGGDPAGYQLITRIRGKLPNVPIIVYSQFDDMGHEKRAFDEGATWFLRKSEYRKLARHLNSIFNNPEWKGEWSSICETTGFKGDEDFIFEDSKDVEFKKAIVNNGLDKQGNVKAYLIYRALKGLPGRQIHLQRLSEGFGGAVTLKAWKGGNISSPVIVKIDSRFNTAMEHARYHRFVRPFLANECGRIERPAISIDNDHSAIVYTYAGRSAKNSKLHSLKKLLFEDMASPSSCAEEKYTRILSRILDDMLLRLHEVDACSNETFGSASSFPNRVLDEVDIPEHDDKFEHICDNYLCRLPLEKRIKEFRFARSESSTSTVSFTFRGGRRDEKKGPCAARMECYDESKCVVSLVGEQVEHVLRYRNHLVPGSYIKIDVKGADPNELKPELNMGRLDEILDKVKFDNDEVNDDSVEKRPNLKMGTKRGAFGALIWSLIGGDAAKKTVFRSLQVACGDEILKNIRKGDWHFLKQLVDLLIPAHNEEDPPLGHIRDHFECPCGIVHGDMNFGNVMVEGTPESFEGVWLIDFARTRRDYITHDFNVLFTSTLSLLFGKDIWSEKGYGAERCHADVLKERFVDIIDAAVFRPHDTPPKLLPEDSRVRMVYSMLRQIRAAALSRGVSLAAYAYTTALMCLVSARVFLEYERNAPSAAGMIVAALVCCEGLLNQKEW